MPKIADSLRYTFPIPSAKLRGRKLKLALGAPVTWAPYLPVVGAFAFLDIGPWLFAGLLGLITVGIGWFWKAQSHKLEGKLFNELVAESNAAQDAALVAEGQKLLAAGHPDYAATLGSFLEKKQLIESAIHSDKEAVASQATTEIETLIDAIVFGISDQLWRLVELNRPPKIPRTADQLVQAQGASEEISKQIHEAWQTIEDTWENLGQLLDPSAGISGEDVSHLSLENAVAKLRHEKEVADRVRTRMTTEWVDQFGDPSFNHTDSAGETE